MTRPSGDAGDLVSPKGAREEPEVEQAYDRLVSEGRDRLARPLLPLCATGFLGGIDVGVGVLIYLVIDARTGDKLLASLAFTIGFIALLMARSELFTENFLVPVTAVVARAGSIFALLRLWLVTLAMNLVAGFLMAGMIVVALPDVRDAARTAGSHYAHLGVSWQSFFLAVLAGAVITLLTRMQHSTEQLGVKIVPAVVMPFILVGAQLFHSVLDSILMFAGLLAGHADYGYGDWLAALGWSALGNTLGGVVLVTSVRLLRVPHRVLESKDTAARMIGRARAPGWGIGGCGSRATVDDMDTYALGQATVHRIGFGAMQLPGPGVLGPPRDHDEAVAVLRRAVELGVNHIDTAQFYGPDVSNELIREALHPYSDDLALVSKVGAFRDDAGAWLPGQRPEQLRSAVEDNLRSLGTDRLAAVNLRLMDEHAPPADQRVALEDQLAEMVALRDEGKIGGVGISSATLAQVEQAIRQADIVCVQNAFSLVDQKDTDVLDLCHGSGIAYVPYFPLGSAFPQMPKVTDNAAVRSVAERVGATPAQVGLAWLLAHRDNVLLIPGTSSVAHLQENMDIAGVQLSDDDIAELERSA